MTENKTEAQTLAIELGDWFAHHWHEVATANDEGVRSIPQKICVEISRYLKLIQQPAAPEETPTVDTTDRRKMLKKCLRSVCERFITPDQTKLIFASNHVNIGEFSFVEIDGLLSEPAPAVPVVDDERRREFLADVKWADDEIRAEFLQWARRWQNGFKPTWIELAMQGLRFLTDGEESPVFCFADIFAWVEHAPTAPDPLQTAQIELAEWAVDRLTPVVDGELLSYTVTDNSKFIALVKKVKALRPVLAPTPQEQNEGVDIQCPECGTELLWVGRWGVGGVVYGDVFRCTHVPCKQFDMCVHADRNDGIMPSYPVISEQTVPDLSEAAPIWAKFRERALRELAEVEPNHPWLKHVPREWLDAWKVERDGKLVPKEQP